MHVCMIFPNFYDIYKMGTIPFNTYFKVKIVKENTLNDIGQDSIKRSS